MITSRAALIILGLSRLAWADQSIEQLMATHHIPSVSIAQISAGHITRTIMLGQQISGQPVTPDTLYNVASLTKPITAQVALELIAKGIISLDEPMYHHWLDPDIATDERQKLLTPRLALSHQTGFPNWRYQTGNKLTFRTDPGNTFGYSGEGYEYLARFIEKKTGQNIEQHARKLIFAPAGMKSTAYTRQPGFDGRIAIPADASGQPLKPTFTDKPVASDLLYTTASDYARFLLHALKSKALKSAQAIEVPTDNPPCRPAAAALCPQAMGMGLGWQVFRFKSKTVLMHTGRDPGLFTFAWLCPTTGNGGVILTSGDKGSEVVIRALRDLAAEPEFIDFLVSSMQ